MGYRTLPGMACCFGVLLVLSAEEPAAPVDYLVLKNGSVLTGRVVQDDKHYILRSLKSTGESRYPAEIVAKHCRSAGEAFLVLKKASAEGDARQHCQLARFCMDHDLMTEAKAEIEAALKADRRSTEAQALVRQVQAKLNPVAKKSVEVPALPTNTVLPMAAVSLDDWPLAQSPALFQEFTSRIQPMLLTGCGTAACHGNAEGKRGYLLKRGLGNIPLSLPHSRNNLERTLALIDRDNPETSELLKRAASPHGNQKHWPVTKEQQETWRQWALIITGKTKEVAKTNEPFGGGNNKPASEGFASGGTATTPPPASGSSSLPSIPGLSGGASQQMGVPPSAPSTPPSSKGLPPIPGVSGKGQGNNPPPPPSQQQQSEPPRAQLPPQEQLAFWDYARRLGILPTLGSNTQPTPDRMLIKNAGTHSMRLPPPIAFSEEVNNQLKRLEEAKKLGSETPAPSSGFLQRGTVVNGPR
jgi:hypothetical protein